MATEYVNCSTLMPYICSCGTESQIRWDGFKIGNRCKNCRSAKLREKFGLDFNFIKEAFKKEGCELLATEYVNSSTVMPYICSCGTESKICWSNFNQGQRCKSCGLEKNRERFKLDFNFVKESFEKGGCELLATEYVNGKTIMPYICECGKENKICWNKFNQGRRCKSCGLDSIKNKLKLDFNFVIEAFEKERCQLLAKTYENSRTLMPYVCSCGNKSKICFSHFQNGKRCSRCFESKGEKKISEFLHSLNLNFDKEIRFSDCRDINPLPFDFGITDSNGKKFLIEYQGEQHYRPIFYKDKNNKNKCFEKLVMHDIMKKEWAKSENIPLLRIAYWDFENIEDLIIEFINQ